jgi:hypothetical protein
MKQKQKNKIKKISLTAHADDIRGMVTAQITLVVQRFGALYRERSEKLTSALDSKPPAELLNLLGEYMECFEEARKELEHVSILMSHVENKVIEDENSDDEDKKK